MNLKKILSRYIVGIMAILATLFPDTSRAQNYNDNDDFELIKNLEIFHTLMQNVRIMFVDEVSSGELIKVGMDAMMKSLDPYTVYYPESLVEDVRFMQTGDYAGIGIEIDTIKNSFVVNAVHKDSPADKAGVIIGDRIISINGKDLTNKTYDEMEMILKGQPGTNVSLSLDHYGKNISMQMKRAMINIPNIPYSGMIADKVGYINLSGFTQDCGRELREAFVKLKNEDKIDKLIIDLRFNPGGLLVEAVNIVNLFVDKGETVVDMRGRVREWNKIFRCENPALDTQIPIVVLVNGNSASASEIVSGALQDLDRAVIIGEKTYGKGLVQSTKELVYNSQMKITTAKYYIPSGRCIQKLDYSHKDSTGKASRIAESQYKTFKTKNGRPVKDAGGIMPDILVSSDTMSYFVENLVDEHILFNYASAYRQKHSEVKIPEEFSITDTDLADFRKYAGEQIYKYKSPADITLEILEDDLRDEYPDADISKMLSPLKLQLQANRQKEFEANKEQIRQELATEIIRRYYYDEGIVRYSLKHDPFVEKAIEVLNDPVLYNKILSGR